MYYLQLLDLLFFVKCLKNPSDSFNAFNHVTFHSGSTRSSSNPKNSEIRSNSLQRPKGSSPCMAVVRRFDCTHKHPTMSDSQTSSPSRGFMSGSTVQIGSVSLITSDGRSTLADLRLTASLRARAYTHTHTHTHEY